MIRASKLSQVRRRAALAACALVALTLFGLISPLPAQEASDLVKAELIAEPSAIVPGEPFTVGIKLTMKEHWHTYWRNPGDSGEPTTVTWKLPPGFSASELEWPAPQAIRLGPVTSFGYEGETMLLARITPPRDLAPDKPATIAADVAYLVCEKICIPGDASVSIELPAGGAAAPSSSRQLMFDAARAKLPQASPWTATFASDPKSFTLSLQAKESPRSCGGFTTILRFMQLSLGSKFILHTAIR